VNKDDRFYDWLEEEVTYLFIPYPLVCGKMERGQNNCGKEKIKLRKCSAYLQKGETPFLITDCSY